MSSQLLNGPRGLALVLTPPVRRRGAASVRRGIRPSGGSTTSQARLFLRSKVSKIRCAGGRSPPANSVPLTPSTNCSLRSLDDLLQLLRRDVGQRLARELCRPLHRRAGLIVVRVDALQVGMSPRRLRRGDRSGRRGPRLPRRRSRRSGRGFCLRHIPRTLYLKTCTSDLCPTPFASCPLTLRLARLCTASDSTWSRSASFLKFELVTNCCAEIGRVVDDRRDDEPLAGLRIRHLA